MNQIGTPTIEQKVKDLEKQLEPYAKLKSGEKVADHVTKDAFFSLKKMYLYIPIVFFILLLIFQPDFIKKTEKHNGKEQKHLCMKKFLLFWMIFSALSCVGIFAYNYKLGGK